MRFRVLEGKAVYRGKQYEKGDVVEAETRLDRIFANKFQKLGKSDEEDDEPEPVRKKVKVKKSDADPGVPEPEARGKDHSAEFRRALKEDLEVFASGGRYNVYKKGSNEKLNEKGLAHGEVNAFIKDYMEK